MNLDEIGRELRASGKLRGAASSPEAGKLLEQLDTGQAERALRQGDGETLRKLMGQVLSTPEGRALAERVRKAVRKDG